MIMVVSILKEIAKALLASLLTEAFIKEVIIYLLEWLASKSDNKVDDDLVAKIKEAMHAKKEEQPKSE
jgi:hypothetical protein